MPESLEPFLFESAQQFETWLSLNHMTNSGIWLRLAKKASRIPCVSYAEALDVALCWGWIDSQKKSFDDNTFQQRFSPRKKDSIWSRINREKVLLLEEQGRMQPAGWRAVEVARANGRWEQAYEGSRRIQVPEDFARLLETDSQARAFLDSLDAANRYAYLFRATSPLPGPSREKAHRRLLADLNSGRLFH